MKKNFLSHGIAPFATVSMMLALAAFTGCEKKPEVYAKRSDDPAYKQDLVKMRTRHEDMAAVRSRIVSQLEELEKRARAALPKDATPEQVKAELDAHPEKYPAWKPMWEALQSHDEKMVNEMKKSQKIVRDRIYKEAAERKAIAEGKATAKTSAATK